MKYMSKSIAVVLVSGTYIRHLGRCLRLRTTRGGCERSDREDKAMSKVGLEKGLTVALRDRRDRKE